MRKHVNEIPEEDPVNPTHILIKNSPNPQKVRK